MVDVSQFTLWKGSNTVSGVDSLGGGVSATQIVNAIPNNLFGVIPAADRITGKDYYKLFYIKNQSGETVKNFKLWLSAVASNSETVVKFGRGSSGRNGTEQTIANINTAPTGITWRTLTGVPSDNTITTFNANDVYPIWLWRHTNAVASGQTNFGFADDFGLFTFRLDFTSGNTPPPPDPDPGGGGGGGGTPPPSTTNYKLAIIGDEGCETRTDSVIALLASTNYDLIVSVGDHAYAAATCWTTKFNQFKARMKSAYGNHEYEESGGTAPYKTFFSDTKTYFTYKYQNVWFLIFDTNIDLDETSTQFEFISDALAAVDNDSAVDWKIAINHHPWWVTGSKHPANEFDQVDIYHQLFIDHNVQFVWSGHNHNWQRTHQLSVGASASTPVIEDSTSPYVSTALGLIHGVSGTSGHDGPSGLYPLPSIPSFQAYQDKTHNGFWEALASNNAKTWTCSFVDTNGNKYDTFVINQA